jgi:site-specific DNA-methyltransferase (cytosine-N4-specific)
MNATCLESKQIYQDRILQGDALKVLSTLPGEMIDCVVTSPPYWGLRDYGVDVQIGLEAHPQQYIDKIVDVFAEIKRVLRSDGTVFLNLGDSYCHSRTGGVDLRTAHGSNSILGHLPQTHCGMNREYFDGKWLQEKQKMLIPERIAIAMQDDGWILRNAIVWHKINHMPESVQDRLTRSYETVFFFTKSKRYFFNLDAIRKENTQATLKRVAFAKKKNETYGVNTNYRYEWNGYTTQNNYARKGRKSVQQSLNPKGANPGDVWSLTTEGNQYSDVKKHYAAFPMGLVRRCLACGCGKDGLVLDPFAGSGTTLYVARKMALHYLGIELNPEYIKIAKKRLDKIPARLDSFIQPMEVCVK